jgi:hypothetical protein
MEANSLERKKYKGRIGRSIRGGQEEVQEEDRKKYKGRTRRILRRCEYVQEEWKEEGRKKYWSRTGRSTRKSTWGLQEGENGNYREKCMRSGDKLDVMELIIRWLTEGLMVRKNWGNAECRYVGYQVQKLLYSM